MKRSKAKLDDKKTPAKADPKAKGKDKSSAAYKLGNEVVGKKIRVKVQEDGHLIQKNGLVVQVKEVEGSQHHRIVWNDGSDDSWLILQVLLSPPSSSLHPEISIIAGARGRICGSGSAGRKEKRSAETSRETSNKNGSQRNNQEERARHRAWCLILLCDMKSIRLLLSLLLSSLSRTSKAIKENQEDVIFDIAADSGTMRSFVPQKRSLDFKTDEVKKQHEDHPKIQLDESAEKKTNQPGNLLHCLIFQLILTSVASSYDSFFEKFRIRDECFRRMQQDIRHNISVLLETYGESILPEIYITDGDCPPLDIENKVSMPPQEDEIGAPVSLEELFLTPLERLVLPPAAMAKKAEQEVASMRHFYGVGLRDRSNQQLHSLLSHFTIRLWELWSENVVKSTEEDTKWREWYAVRFHEIEPGEVCMKNNRRRNHLCTEDYIGPNAMRVVSYLATDGSAPSPASPAPPKPPHPSPDRSEFVQEATEEETRSFFESLYLCNFRSFTRDFFDLNRVRIGGKEIVLPGREKIARKMQLAYAE
eukprot:752506-Hanusia_phi.AAC.15